MSVERARRKRRQTFPKRGVGSPRFLRSPREIGSRRRVRPIRFAHSRFSFASLLFLSPAYFLPSPINAPFFKFFKNVLNAGLRRGFDLRVSERRAFFNAF
jgi:hypothetical protein